MAYSDSLSAEHHKMLRDEIHRRSDSKLAEQAQVAISIPLWARMWAQRLTGVSVTPVSY